MGNIRGKKSLEEYCKEIHKEYLLKEWDYEENKISPADISYGSHKIVSWKCSKGHKYQKDIHSRCQGVGCSQCSGIVFIKQDKIFDKYPKYIKDLDEEYNTYEDIKNYTCGSSKKVHWKCSKGHKYVKSICNKIKGDDCPICLNKQVLKGYNDLETWCKNNNEDIILDWDYSKNKIKPNEIVIGSAEKIFFKCHVCGHEWRAKLYSRTKQKSDCPRCKIRSKTSFPEQAIFYYMKKYFSDAISGDRKKLNGRELDIYIPSKKVGIEYDGKLWHQDKQKDLEKEKMCKKQGIRLIKIVENNTHRKDDNIYSYTYPNWEELSDIITKILISLGMSKLNIDIDKDQYKIKEQYFSIMKDNSLAVLYPDIAKEWHPTKNGNITPDQISSETHDSYYWICSKCGKEYKAMVKNRVRVGSGCKDCGQKTTAKKQMIKVINLDTNEVFESVKEIEKKYNFRRGGIINCCRGVTKTSNGYHWAYLDRENAVRKKRLKLKNQKKVMNTDTGEIYDSLCEAVEKTKIVNIQAVCSGRREKAGGYHWKYLDDEK